MAFKPLIDLRPTTIRKAFLVNGIVAATIAAFTVEFRRALDYTEETKGLTRPQKLGMTTVYVTHDQREALTMSDRVAVINDGKLMQLDSPRQIYDQPASTFVANFIGESTLLPVDHRNGQVSYAGNPIDIKGSESKNGSFLMLRPERLILLSSNNDSAYNTFQGKVKDIVYQGESFLLYVTLIDGTDVAVRSVSQKDLIAAVPEVNSQIVLGLHPDETVLIPDDNE